MNRNNVSLVRKEHPDEPKKNADGLFIDRNYLFETIEEPKIKIISQTIIPSPSTSMVSTSRAEDVGIKSTSFVDANWSNANNGDQYIFDVPVITTAGTLYIYIYIYLKSNLNLFFGILFKQKIATSNWR